jgi:hypothetical protein
MSFVVLFNERRRTKSEQREDPPLLPLLPVFVSGEAGSLVPIRLTSNDEANLEIGLGLGVWSKLLLVREL